MVQGLRYILLGIFGIKHTSRHQFSLADFCFLWKRLCICIVWQLHIAYSLYKQHLDILVCSAVKSVCAMYHVEPEQDVPGWEEMC